MLINSDVEIVEVDAAFIRNVNTPEEFELAKKRASIKETETSSADNETHKRSTF